MMKIFSVIFGVLFCINVFSFDPVIVVVGSPGSGKGHFSQFLSNNYGYGHIDAGGLLRNEVEKKTDCGMKIAPFLERGEPVEPQIMWEILKREIETISKKTRNFVIDGFGGQYREDVGFLVKCLKDLGLDQRTFVVFLESSEESCKRRMSDRVICPLCDRIYNLSSDKPKHADKCDDCDQQLITRTEDRDKIAHRLKGYRDRMKGNYAQFADHFPSLTVDVDKEDDVRRLYGLVNDIEKLEAPDFFSCYCSRPTDTGER